MDEVVFFWSGHEPLLRTCIIGALAFIGIVLGLSVSGNRRVLRMSGFELVVAGGIGLALGLLLPAEQDTLPAAAAAFPLLVVLWLTAGWLRNRQGRTGYRNTGSPALLYYQGRFLKREMMRQRIGRESVLTAARENGLASLDEAAAVILEKGGHLSVIKRTGKGTKVKRNGQGNKT